MKRLIEIGLQCVDEETAENFEYEVVQIIRKSVDDIIATWSFTGNEGFIVIRGKSYLVEDLLDDIYELSGEFPSIIMETSRVKLDDSHGFAV